MTSAKKLKLLQEYGEKAFTDVAHNSKFKNKKLCGYVYSPYLFRRWIGSQLEKAVIWGVQHREDNLFSCVCCTMHSSWFKQELSTLAILEKSSPNIFKERSQFLPLSLISDIAKVTFTDYQEAADFFIEHPGWWWYRHELRDHFVRAGIFYRERNRIAFGGGSVEEFEKARIEIPKWNRAQMEQYLKNIADEYVASGSAQKQKAEEPALKAMTLF